MWTTGKHKMWIIGKREMWIIIGKNKIWIIGKHKMWILGKHKMWIIDTKHRSACQNMRHCFISQFLILNIKNTTKDENG